MSEEQKQYGDVKSDVTKEIEKARQAGANLLLPSTNVHALSDWHAPVVDSVRLSPDKIEGDVYPAGTDDDGSVARFRISAQGLRKLSVCAGIIWHPYECRRLDDRKDRDYVAFQAIGGIRKADGQAVWWKGEYDLDFEVIREELIDQYTNKCKDWNKPKDYKQAYIDRNVRRDLLFKRKHKIKLAETGAMTRVIRAILGIKSSYTKDELLKAFVMVRIILRPDFTDKDVRAKLADAAIKAMVGIYGPEAPIEPPRADLSKMGEVIDIRPDEEEPSPEPEPENGHDDEPSAREVFEGLLYNEKVKAIEEMAQKKGYSLDDLEYPPQELSERNLIRLYDHLDRMMVDDDIPF